MHEIYKQQGLILKNVELIVRFPFTHAIAYSLYSMKDALLKDLLEFIISSQTNELDMGDLISLEHELAQCCAHAVNHPNIVQWLRVWLFNF